MVKRSWDGNLSLRINDINLLSDVSEKLIREINFNIDLNEVNEQSINQVFSIIKKHPGKHNLKLNIYNQNVNLNFLSKKYQVHICSDLINEMSFLSKEFRLK